MSISASIPYSQLEKAFVENNAQAIVSMGKDKILLKVKGKEAVYSQSQAGMVLKDFFATHPASSFSFTFRGKESNDGCFAVGQYVSKSETFRVSIHFTKVGDSQKIESLSIEN